MSITFVNKSDVFLFSDFIGRLPGSRQAPGLPTAPYALLVSLPDQTLISTSTPEGSSSFISASIVLGVDE